MTALKTTLRNLPTKGRLERMQLTTALRKLGVKGMRRRDRSGGICGSPTEITYRLKYLNEWQVADLYDRAHEVWLAGCKLIQTQFTRNHELAARWNALWQRIKELFMRRLNYD